MTRGATMRILIAEDNPAVGEIYQMVLTACGHHVELVTTFDEALRALKNTEHHAVITDGHYPGGLPDEPAGLRLLDVCQRERIPALLITGDEQLALTANGRGHWFMLKPVMVPDLMGWVDGMQTLWGMP